MERLPVCDAFIAAAEQCGYRRNPDFNGAAQEGFGYYQLTSRRGRRCSASVGYLKPARRRPNLRVVSQALATRVLFWASGVLRGYLWLIVPFGFLLGAAAWSTMRGAKSSPTRLG